MKDKLGLSIKENFDDDLSDDVDDEVFVRDGKRGILKTEKHRCDERPLMPMRRKSKARSNGSGPEVRSRQPCNIYNCLLPVYFAVAAIISIGVLMLLYVFLVDKLPLLVGKMIHWLPSSTNNFDTVIAPCSNYKLDRVWMTNIPTAISDSQIELVDVDRDNISDIVIGVSAKWKDFSSADSECFQSTRIRNNLPPCKGGIVAINGQNGLTIWRQQLSSTILSVQCRLEKNGDSVNDCVLTGKEGFLAVLNGADGKIIWQKPTDPSCYDLLIYNVLVIHDVNNDGYFDILATRFCGAKQRSELEIISGADGNGIAKIDVLDVILIAPQLLIYADGWEIISFFTGGTKGKSAIHIISLHDLIMENGKKIKTLHHFDSEILAAPLLVDINLDSVFDLIFIVGSSVYVLDGTNFQPIWNVSLQAYVDSTSRITSVSSPTAAYFNDDLIPDFLITFVVGSTYPNWHYSLIVVLDGKTGESFFAEPIIQSDIVDTGGAISLSFQGYGNDAFIYWTSSCKNYTRAKKPFTLDQDVNDRRFVDLCHLRFNTSTSLDLFALNQHVQPSGIRLVGEESHLDELSKNEDIDIYASPDWFIEKLHNFYEKGDQSINENDWENIPKLRRQRTLNSNPPSLSNLKSNTFDIEEDSHEDIRMQNQRLQYDEILPRTSASAVLTKSISDQHLDLIVSFYQVPANPNGCITVDQHKHCSHKTNKFNSRTRDPYNRMESLDLKQAIFSSVTVTRYRFSCECQLLRKEKKETCSKILPFDRQSYPASKGRDGNAAYHKRETYLRK